MKHLALISMMLCGSLRSEAQLYVPPNAIVHIGEGATLEVGGDLENNGVMQNFGTLAIYKDWVVNNSFDGLQGTLVVSGATDQLIDLPSLIMSEMIFNLGGEVTFNGVEHMVLEGIDFQSGIVTPSTNTRFVLAPNVTVNGGSNFSYFNGALISEGSGIKIFPLGNEGLYAPLTLLNVFGVDTEITADFLRENTVANPIPGDSLLGVSNRGLWEVELTEGSADPTPAEISFSEEDLTNFSTFNNIRHRVNSPVIAVSDNPAGEFLSLGVAELIDTDSTSFGTITSEKPISLTLGEKAYLAMALAPRIPEEGLFFIPEAFSPEATDPINRTFKIMGEKIALEGFDLQIYNRLGVLVYSTTSFAEANENGWSGTNQNTGEEEPAGAYYYNVKFQFRTGLEVNKSGACYLVR